MTGIPLTETEWQWLDAPCEPVPGAVEIAAWITACGGDAVAHDAYGQLPFPGARSSVTVVTPDGTRHAAPGDYFVRGPGAAFRVLTPEQYKTWSLFTDAERRALDGSG